MQDYKTMIAMCEEQEEKFQFEHFSREDALKIGLKLHENAKEQPVAVEITVNGLVVFRYFAEGAKPDSELWLARKRNAVDLMETSSLRFFAELEDAGETFADRKLDPNEYAAGGGFPIRLRGGHSPRTSGYKPDERFSDTGFSCGKRSLWAVHWRMRGARCPSHAPRAT